MAAPIERRNLIPAFRIIPLQQRGIRDFDIAIYMSNTGKVATMERGIRYAYKIEVFQAPLPLNFTLANAYAANTLTAMETAVTATATTTLFQTLFRKFSPKINFL